MAADPGVFGASFAALAVPQHQFAGVGAVVVDAGELEEFIAANGLNERAAGALRTVSPVIQRAVMDLGSLLSCRDASAGLLGRIHRAQSGQLPTSGTGGATVHVSPE